MAPVPKVAAFINKSPLAQKILRYTNNNTAVFSAVTSFGLASLLRPALIGCFNFKDPRDKRYSQVSSFVSGIIELAASVALFIPLNKSIAKTSKALYESRGSFYHENKLALRQFKSITNRGAKLLALIPMSLARFSLVKPVVNFLFGKEEKGKAMDIAKATADFENFRNLTMKGRLDKWA